jgi:hypothetical protein
MKHVFKVEGGSVVLDSKQDETIYQAPQNPPNTGTAYTRGTDLKLHISRKGRKFFYLLHWSMWQGEEDSIELISEQEAKDFLIQKTQSKGWEAPTEDELKRVQELFTDLLEETV